MKKKLLLLLALVLVFACAALASCDMVDNVTSKIPFLGGDTTTAPAGDVIFADVAFENVTAKYDGTAKTVAATNLPEGATVLYSIDGAEAVAAVSIVDAGVYTVEAQLTAATGETFKKTATLTIEKIDYVLENPEQYYEAESTIPYDGGYHTPVPSVALPDGLSGIPKGDAISAPGETATYDIEFAFSDPTMARNYNPPAGISGIKLTIAKATIDVSGVVFEDATVPYDGEFHTLAKPANIPAELNARVSGGGSAQGKYTVTLTFSFKKASDANLYELPAPMTAVLTVGAGQITLPNLFGDKTVAYTGENMVSIVPAIDGIASHTIEIKNADDEVVNEAVLPGEYTVSIMFVVADTDKYLPITEPVTYKLVITKAEAFVAKDPEWAPVGGWDVETNNGGYFVKGSDDAVAPGVKVILSEDLQNLGVEVNYLHTLNGVPCETLVLGGLYTTKVTLTLESDLYVLPANYTSFTYTWLYSDKSVNLDDITFADDTVTYDGEAHKLELNYTTTDGEGEEVNVAGIKGATLVVTDANGNVVDLGEGFVNAGVYTFTVTFETDAANGYAPLTVTKTLTIKKAVIDVSEIDIAWDFAGTDGKAYIVYDGSNHEVKLTADAEAALTAAGVKVTYSANKAKAPGEYVAVATLSCDANYELTIGTLSFAWQIANTEDNVWTPDPIQ